MLIIIIGLLISMSIILINSFMLIKVTNIKNFKITDDQIKKYKVSDKFLRYLERSNVEIEKFTLINALGLLLILMPIVKVLVTKAHLNLSEFFIGYMIIALFNIRLISKNNIYKNEVKKDIEKIMRISYFLEITGTKEREIYRHLSKSIIGPMSKFIDRTTSSYKLRVDQRELSLTMREELSDIQEAVIYANICLQKMATGASDRILKNQLKSIKKMKQEQYKVKRHNNRLKLIFMSLLLLISFMSVVIYPLLKDMLSNIETIL